MRRGLVKPFFPLEVEPGQASRHALSVVHPFNSDVALDPVLAANIKQVCDEPAKVVAARNDLLTHWRQRAIDLLPATLAELQKVSAAPLRRLLRGAPDDQTPELGQCLHTALWRLVHEAEDQGPFKQYQGHRKLRSDLECNHQRS